MSADMTMDDAFIPQDTSVHGHRCGVIRVSPFVMESLDIGIDLTGCTVQGEFIDKGVFADLHDTLLLPASYTIVGLFLRAWTWCWEIVVESPALPALERGSMPPLITPIYEVTYEIAGQEVQTDPTRSVRLKEIRVEGRQEEES